jgi:hypothetical protein
MDNRISFFSFDDFALSPESVGNVVTQTCMHSPLKYEVRGVAALNGRVLFFLSDKKSLDCVRYVVDELGDLNDQEMIEVVNRRWQGGFTTIGLVKIYSSYFGIFESRTEFDEDKL